MGCTFQFENRPSFFVYPLVCDDGDMTHALSDHMADHLPRIRGVVARIARDEGLVDDIVQECCVRLIEKENLWKKQDKLGAWINAVSRHVTIDFLRKTRSRKPEVPLEEEALVAPSDRDFSEEDIRWVISQFRHLTPMQKQVMHLMYFEGLKAVDVAGTLGISPSAVSQHSSAALATLRRRAGASGLLAMLLPWNWKLEQRLGELIMITKNQKIATAVGLTLGLMGGVAGTTLASRHAAEGMAAAGAGSSTPDLMKQTHELLEKNQKLEESSRQMKNAVAFLEAKDTAQKLAKTTPLPTTTAADGTRKSGKGFTSGIFRAGLKSDPKLRESLKGVVSLIDHYSRGEKITDEDMASLSYWNGYKTFLMEEMGQTPGVNGNIQLLSDPEFMTVAFQSITAGIVGELSEKQSAALEKDIVEITAQILSPKEDPSEALVGYMGFWRSLEEKMPGILTSSQLEAYRSSPAANFFHNNNGLPTIPVEEASHLKDTSDYFLKRFKAEPGSALANELSMATGRLLDRVREIDLQEFKGRGEAALTLEEKTRRRMLIYATQIAQESEIRRRFGIKLEGASPILVFEKNKIEDAYRVQSK